MNYQDSQIHLWSVHSVLVPMMATMLAIVVGCDEQAIEEARRAADRQAQQNQEMARVTREAAEGAKRLVEEDAKARRELLQVQRELQNERSEMNAGWNSLESERKAIAAERLRESFLRYALEGLAMLLIAALAIGAVWAALHGIRHDGQAAEELCDLLVAHVSGDASHSVLPAHHQVAVLPEVTGPLRLEDTMSPSSDDEEELPW